MAIEARQINEPSSSSPKLALYPASLAPAKVSPGVLAKVGETFAVALSTLQGLLATVGTVTPSQQALLDSAEKEIGRLESLGVRIQELARLLAGDAPVPAERIELARAVREALDTWAPVAQRQGASLSATNEAFELEVNGAVLGHLLDLALEYALQIGSHVEFSGSTRGQAAHPALNIRIQRAQAPLERSGEEDFNELHWLLFAQLARAVGLVPQRLAAGQTVTLTLGFPRCGELGADDGGPSPARLPRSASVMGRHVLLIEPQDILRVRAYRLMSEAGMRVDSAATIQQARASLQSLAPDVIVTGLPVDDADLGALLNDARIARPELHVIELVDDDSAFAFAVPGSDMPARVGRHDIARTLVPAVSQELDAEGCA